MPFVCLFVFRNLPLHGLETIYRDDRVAGFVRRASYGFTLGKSIAYGYITRHDGLPVTTDYLQRGNYAIEHLGHVVPAQIHLKSPFDPENRRVKGIYQTNASQ